ncbi:MAG: GDSL-type esterase/lipase family protein, partial [Candidatus Binatia bacterium]
RLLAVGDSFTFGTGVAEEATYLAALERIAGGRQALVTYNAAVPGFGPIDELIVLRRHLADVAPHVVVVGLYSGNDLDDVLLARRRLAGKSPAEPELDSPERARAGRWVHLPDLAARLAEVGYWLKSSRAFDLAWPGLSGWASRLGWTRHRDSAKQPLLLRSLRSEPDAEVRATTATLADTLAEAADLCGKRNARLVVMLIPFRQLVEPGSFERVVAGLASSERAGISRNALHSHIRLALEERGVSVLDLQPRLEARLAEGARLFFSEGHLTAAGHGEVAAALADFLRERGWIPGAATG